MSTKIKTVEQLDRMDIIVDLEGNRARVVRVRRIDHRRARLETDLGVHQVLLKDRFEVVGVAKGARISRQ